MLGVWVWGGCLWHDMEVFTSCYGADVYFMAFFFMEVFTLKYVVDGYFMA